MKTKQWDKDIEKSEEYNPEIKSNPMSGKTEGIHKTALDLINDYWNNRREVLFNELRREREEREKEE